MSKSNAAFNLKGRGILGGLLSEPKPSAQITSDSEQESAAKWIPLEKIQKGTFQPRQYFSQAGIDRLAQSFKERGFKGALNVRPLGDDTYELIASERRWRAAKQANLKEVRCLVDAYSDEEALEFALVENLQREDLSKLEETEGILDLIGAKLGIDRERSISIIRTEGHSDQRGRSDVAPSEALKQIEALLTHFGIELQTFRTKNLRTLLLPDDLKEAHLKENLSYSSALELSKLKGEQQREALLAEVLTDKLSFREIKERVRALTTRLRALTTRQSGGDGAVSVSLVLRLQETAKRAKKLEYLFEKTQKKKRLEKLLRELEALLEESESTGE